MGTNGKALGELKTVTYIAKPRFFASKSRAVSFLSRPPLAFGEKTVETAPSFDLKFVGDSQRFCHLPPTIFASAFAEVDRDTCHWVSTEV